MFIITDEFLFLLDLVRDYPGLDACPERDVYRKTVKFHLQYNHCCCICREVHCCGSTKKSTFVPHG